MNEAIRVVCEMNGFEPVSEPTEKQRKFFSDTAYADDELQLRRTILARIATLDTSVKDPTDEQLEETAEMLEMVMEVGAPQNEWEQQAVKRLHDVVIKSLESTRANGSGTPAPKEHGSVQADIGGGQTDDERRRAATQFVEERGMDTSSSADMDTQTLEGAYRTHDEGTGGGAAPEAVETALPGETGRPTETHARRDGGADAPADGQAPERAVAQRGPDGYYRDSNGRIVSQRTVQAEVDRRRRGGNMV